METDLINKRISAYSDPTRVAKIAAVHFPINSNKRNEFIYENCLFDAKTWRDLDSPFGFLWGYHPPGGQSPEVNRCGLVCSHMAVQACIHTRNDNVRLQNLMKVAVVRDVG